MSKHLVDIEHERLSFFTPAGEVKALDDVSFYVNEGEVLGVVGESGSGKSVTSYSLMGLIANPGKIIGGDLYFNGYHINEMSEKEMRKIRGNEVSIIFQDPMTSLNPVYTIGIAMALACEPKLLIADEPTTALDVTIQAQIIELMIELKNKLGMAIIMITHDLGVVANICDRIAVMYAGKIIESGLTDDIFYNPKHEYTKGLLKSIPKMYEADYERLVPIEGTPVDMLNPPKGCPFASRCDSCMKICLREMPPVKNFSETHYSQCWLNELEEDNNTEGESVCLKK